MNMDKYEKLLIEMGEKTYLPSSKKWPVELRLLFVIIVQTAFFVVGKMFLGGAAASVINSVSEMKMGNFASAAARSAEDASFRDLEGYLLGSAPLVTALYNASAVHALRAREQAQLLLDFGAALRALGQTEGGALGDSLSAVGLAAWASSTAEYEAAVCATEALVERLADYVRLARAVRETLDARARASADLADALTHVERLKARCASLWHPGAAATARPLALRPQPLTQPLPPQPLTRLPAGAWWGPPSPACPALGAPRPDTGRLPRPAARRPSCAGRCGPVEARQ
jgi:hypothetical protein